MKSSMVRPELIKNESLMHKLIKKWFWLYILSYLAAPAGYLTRVIVSNSISVEEVWILYSVYGFFSLISIYNDLGLTESLKYFLPKYRVEKRKNAIKTSIIISLAVQFFTAIVLIAVVWRWSPWLAIHYFKSPESIIVLKIFCFYFLGKNVYEVISSIFSAFQDTFNQKIIELVRMRSIVCFTVLFFILGKWSLFSYSVIWVSSLFIALAFAVYLFMSKYKYLLTEGSIALDKPMISEYAKYALRIFIGINAANLLTNIDQQMVIAILWARSAAYYANYASLLNTSWILIGPILSLILPLVSELLAKNDSEKISVLQNFLYTYVTILAMSYSGLLFSLWPEIATVLFWQKFIFSGELLNLWAFSIIPMILLWICLSILTWMWRIKDRVLIIWIVWVLNVLMNFFFAKLFGLYGIIISTIIWLLIMLAVTIKIIHRQYPITVQRKLIINNLWLVILLSGIVLYLKPILFTLTDEFRYSNFLRLWCISISYWIIFIWLNYKKIILLKNEIALIRKES